MGCGGTRKRCVVIPMGFPLLDYDRKERILERTEGRWERVDVPDARRVKRSEGNTRERTGGEGRSGNRVDKGDGHREPGRTDG